MPHTETSPASRPYNFRAGPAMLPVPVLQQVREELMDWRGTGVSVMEIGHRESLFMEMASEVTADIRHLAAISEDYDILFLPGGARLQFAMVPLNISRAHNHGNATEVAVADYVHSGYWAACAISEAARFIRVHTCASLPSHAECVAPGTLQSSSSPSSARQAPPLALPPQSKWHRTPHARYVHYTPNETISGLAFAGVPDVGDTPLVADMSSSLFSAPLDIKRFGLVYACAQKNLGIAGLTIVIIRRDLLSEEVQPAIPHTMQYRAQAMANSMLSTPPVFAWYVAGLVVRWLLQQGGLPVIGERNRAKAEVLYRCIDNAGGFYRNHVHRDWRSLMNVTFTLHEPSLESVFIKEATANGLVGLAGHASAGGLRASLYNAMPLAGLTQLVDFMNEFQRRRG